MKLYKLIGGCDTTIVNNATHTAKDTRPSIYIVSHKFSYFDIVVTLEIFSQLLNQISRRVIAGVCDVPDWFRIIFVYLCSYLFPTLQLIAYNKRHGNTTRELSKHLFLSDDIIIWQHPYNKSRGLYYMLYKCIYERGVLPRLVYIDISDKVTTETINNDTALSIIRKTRNNTYYVTSYEIEYKIDREMPDDIYEQFIVPLWDKVKLAKNNNEHYN